MIRKFINNLELRWSDLLFLLGFLPFTLFLIFGQALMQTLDPNELGLPLWAVIICFIISVSSWGGYIYLENKRGNKVNNVITYIFIFLALLNIVTIIVQPATIIENVICRNINGNNPDFILNQAYPIAVSLSSFHRVFFSMYITLVLGFIYTGLFIFPKRFKSVIFIKYLAYALFMFLFVLIVAGWIIDGSKFPGFVKSVLGIIDEDPANYAMVAFIIHRNAYGMAMMLGIIFALINHSITKNWKYYLLVAFFFFHLLLSWCKTGILLSALILFIYVVYRLITTYKEHEKRNKNILIAIGSVIVLAIAIVGVSYLSKGKILGKVYSMIKGSDEKVSSLFLRSLIWDNCYQLLQNGNWLIGRGFGTLNNVLFEMNKVNGDIVFPTHNAFICLLAEGGILFLLAFLLLVIYSGKIVYEDYKKNPLLTVAMSLGALCFLLYGFVEAIQYLFYVFLLPLFILHELPTKQEA